MVAIAIQQARAEFVLKVADLCAQGRLREVQVHSGAAEAELFCDGDEVAQMTQFHRELIAFVYHAQSNKVLSNAWSGVEGEAESRTRNHEAPHRHHR